MDVCGVVQSAHKWAVSRGAIWKAWCGMLWCSMFARFVPVFCHDLLPVGRIVANVFSANVVAKVVASADVSSVASVDVSVFVTLSFVSPAVRLPDVLLRMKWHMDIECSWKNEGGLCELPSILHATSPSRCP